MQIPKEAIRYVLDCEGFSGAINEGFVIQSFLQWQAENPCWDCFDKNKQNQPSDVCKRKRMSIGIIDFTCLIKVRREQYKKEAEA